jgi:hypothetical protein
LFRGKLQKIYAAHHFGHSLLGIVHDRGQMTSRNAVTSMDHEVAGF